MEGVTATTAPTLEELLLGPIDENDCVISHLTRDWSAAPFGICSVKEPTLHPLCVFQSDACVGASGSSFGVGIDTTDCGEGIATARSGEDTDSAGSGEGTASD